MDRHGMKEIVHKWEFLNHQDNGVCQFKIIKNNIYYKIESYEKIEELVNYI